MTTTEAPSVANALAMSAPMPFDAPVTTAPVTTATLLIKNIATQTVGDELTFARRLDQAGDFEFLHVVGDSGGGDLAAACADGLAGKTFSSAANAPEQIVASRVRERLGNQVEAGVGESRCSHSIMSERFRNPFGSHRLESANGVCKWRMWWS